MHHAKMTRNRVLVASGAQLTVLGLGAHAMAQDAAQERSQSFQAVTGAVREDVPGGPLLVGAYGLIWLAVLAYVVRLVRLQRRAQSDLARLERLVSRIP